MTLYQSIRIGALLMAAQIASEDAFAQDCPPNIGFEDGSFQGWTCYTGNVQAAGATNVINLSPSGVIPGQHTLLSALANGRSRDFYGDFPVVCPNGSGYSVLLGNTAGGAQAEGLSYEFTIPANRQTFSLVYNYAVVFQDPNHQFFEQPRLVLEVNNLTDNTKIQCSSFTFFPNGSPLPGFFQSPRSDSIAVWCKDWSAVSINLNNMAGKRIQLFFKTADCTFRRHFGYAYIDVNTECSSEFTGAVHCADDTAVNVTAPYGYQAYNWFDAGFTTSLGQQQTLVLSPPPPRGTTLAVELVPYNGYGCLDTLYAVLRDTLSLVATAGPDRLSCNGQEVMIGSNQLAGVRYRWTPDAGLSNALAANPLASPPTTTAYVLTVQSQGGGCLNRDTVVVRSRIIDSSLRLTGPSLFCVTSGDSAVLEVNPSDSIEWYRNNQLLTGARQTRLRITQTGTYQARLISREGCERFTRPETITVEAPRMGQTYPLKYGLTGFPVSLEARNFGNQYNWSPGELLETPLLAQTLFTPRLVEDRRFTVEITTAAGCLTVDTQWVRIVRAVQVRIPTAFTPNNDGRNDLFRPLLEGVREIRYFRVYNRWGQLLYQWRGGDSGWNGSVNGIPQESGVYVWMLEATGLDNKAYFRKGTVTLIR